MFPQAILGAGVQKQKNPRQKIKNLNLTKKTVVFACRFYLPSQVSTDSLYFELNHAKNIHFTWWGKNGWQSLFHPPLSTPMMPPSPSPHPHTISSFSSLSQSSASVFRNKGKGEDLGARVPIISSNQYIKKKRSIFWYPGRRDARARALARLFMRALSLYIREKRKGRFFWRARFYLI